VRTVVLSVLAACIGCGPGYKLAPVSGTLKVNGKLRPDAHITFEPVVKEGKRGPPSAGITDAAGKYQLKTIDGDMGAVVGKHRVSVITASAAQVTNPSSDEADPKKPKEVFPPKYNTKSELTADVSAEGTDAADFDLPIP
jgi:hypothetical protein